MGLRFLQTSVRWISVLSFLLFGGGRAAVAQIDLLGASIAPTPQIEDAPSRFASPIPSGSEVEGFGQSLDPYRSLERFVAPADRGVSLGVPVQTRPKPHVTLSRSGSLFWGAVGLFVHSYCDTRTDEFSPMTDRLHEYRTFDDARCDQCDRIGKRALGAVIGGLLSVGSSR